MELWNTLQVITYGKDFISTFFDQLQIEIGTSGFIQKMINFRNIMKSSNQINKRGMNT